MQSQWLQLVTPATILESAGATVPHYTEEDAFWFAVPKKKVTRHKKRLKTTAQKRIPLRKDIVIDPRTGEVTLKHRLPANWKNYLPKFD